MLLIFRVQKRRRSCSRRTLVCMFAVPNFFPDSMVQRWPAWAQRHIVLGLDLQGGSHILLEVDANDVRRQKVEGLRDDVRRVLRDARVGITGQPVIRGNTVEVHIRDSDLQQGLTKLRELSTPIGGLLGATTQRSVDIVNAGGGLVQLTVTDPAILQRMRQVVGQSIEIIERRVNQIGTVEPLIQPQGTDRILVQVPGLAGSPAPEGAPGQDRQARVQDGRRDDADRSGVARAARRRIRKSCMAPRKKAGPPYLIEKRVLVAGGDLTDAQPGFDQRTSEPIVQFRFNSSGARKFAQATQENVGRPFAIVLDNEVISAPVIREPILQGSGQISGSFTVQGANDLSVLLRAGALAGQAEHHRGAHGRTGPRAGLDREGQARLGGRLADGGGLHAGDLRPVRPVRQYRGRDQCRR